MEETEDKLIEATPERIKEIRDLTGCGVWTARKVATKEALLDAIDKAETVDDLKPILRTLAWQWGK